ncbi:hypothetical protein FJQ98_11895 [Lysinibacillus agricola]|uniref:Uncharacterized protein n=1 Tax=Lysinibacillus agricola TaxID=2590012 RepID=A0ABX7AXE5_9BACI|nr:MULTISPECIES: hypothetical protein [Lysinibacillus]QQP14637.1 hypothetical protein FJQ98_11895 [Lysinibacillus agricola]
MSNYLILYDETTGYDSALRAYIHSLHQKHPETGYFYLPKKNDELAIFIPSIS